MTLSEDPLDLAVVGAGRVGTVLAVLLVRAGHRVVAASGREGSRARVARHLPGVPFVSDGEAAAAAGAVILGVPDDLLEVTSRRLARSNLSGRFLVHLSGSAPLDALAAAAAAGARPLSVHPLQTFPDVESALVRLPGSAIAVTAADEEGYALGERLTRDAGGRPFRLPDDRKPLYHAAAVFCSNYLAVVEGVAERLFGATGLEEPLEKLAPLARGTLDNALRLGPAAALTGPAARGDAGTIRRNLEALEREAPSAVPAYVELARLAAEMAERSGRLDAAGRSRVEEALAPWR